MSNDESTQGNLSSVPGSVECGSPQSGREGRLKLVRQIEDMRKSQVVAYICGDRQGAPQAQIGDDAVRPMYDHIRDLPSSSKIDLFPYSRGGAVEVPWRMVTMLREHCSQLGVLIPYRAHSAATLIALGCDEIIMGKKAELGPIDPALSITQDGGTAVQEQIRVEDVMSFVRFLKEVPGLTEQSALAENVRILTEKLSPWVLGSIYRTHAHIRMVAQRMLSCHAKKLDDEIIERITETLAAKIYSHGHAICRREAKEMGLPVKNPPADLELLMWALLEEYEDVLCLNKPLDPDDHLSEKCDSARLDITIGLIESETITSAFNGCVNIRQIRKTPPQVNINLNLGISLPPGIDPRAVPPELQKAVDELLKQIQMNAPKWVREQTQSQSPITGIEVRFAHGAWRDVTKEGI